MKLRVQLPFAVLGALLVAGACSNPTSLRARFETLTDTVVVYALSGTPAAYPSALNIPYRAAVRADGNLAFDVALDLNANGDPLVYPLKLVASAFGSSRPVGLLRTASPFDSVTRAPGDGYGYDSVVVAPRGTTVIVQASTSYCQLDFSQIVYAKLAVDSIDLAARRMVVRMVVNPNCGFRSFLPGIPEN